MLDEFETEGKEPLKENFKLGFRRAPGVSRGAVAAGFGKAGDGTGEGDGPTACFPVELDDAAEVVR